MLRSGHSLWKSWRSRHGQRALLAGVLDAATLHSVMVTDANTRITVFSRGAERLLGYSAAEVLGTSPLRFFEPDELSAAAAQASTAADERAVLHGLVAGEPMTRQWTWRRRDATTVRVQLTLTQVVGASGAPTGAVVGVASDISALAAAEERLRRSSEQFQLAFETAPSAMAVISLAPGRTGRLVRVNDSFATFTGRSRRELSSMRMAQTLHPEEVPAHEAYLQRAADHAETEPAGVQRRFTTPDGQVRIGRKSTSLLSSGQSDHPHLLVIIEDITAAVASAELLRRAALHDELTGLANRTLLTARLQEALREDSSTALPPPTGGSDGLGGHLADPLPDAARSLDEPVQPDLGDAAVRGALLAPGGTAQPDGRRQADRVAVLYLDLNGFKAVNDTHGHAAGDHLLREVATQLRTAVRVGDTVARLGGDEFAIVCPGLDPRSAQHLVARLRACLEQNVELPDGTVLQISASIGLVAAQPGERPHQVLDRADAAMYQDKRTGERP